MIYCTYNKDAEIIHGLGICHCYNPTLAYQAVHEVLKLVKAKQDYSNSKAYEEWDNFLKDPYKAYTVYSLNNLCPEYNDKNLDTYLDHGTSICSCWLTETGERLLEIMNNAWDSEKEEYDFEDAESQLYFDKYMDCVEM